MRLICLLLTASLFSFCQSASSGAASSGVTSSGVTSPGAAAAGGASFSCMIDGVAFSSNETDGMGNAAFKTAKDIVTFSLISLDPKYKGRVPPQFSLTIAPSGTSHFNSADGNAKYSARYSPADYPDAYNAESGSATVTSLTADRVQGTFSGVFSGMGKTFKVTAGKFDLPKAKYSGPLL